MLRVFVLVSLIVFSQIVFSQDYQPVERYTIADGLSHSSITCLHTDMRDLLWIGTSDGLSRFNGVSFHNYQASIYDTISLPNDYIIDIAEDAEGNIWCLTPLALCRYIPNSDGFKSFFVLPGYKENLTPVKLKDFSIDNERGVIFVLGEEYLGEFDISSRTFRPILSNLINSNDFEKILSVDYHPLSKKLLLNVSPNILEYSLSTDSLINYTIPVDKTSRIIKTTPARNEEYYAFSKDRIWIKKKNAVFEELKLASELLTSNEKIIDLVSSDEDNIEIITTKKVLSYNSSNNEITGSLNFSLLDFSTAVLSSYNIMKCGVFWLGTDQGLLKFNKHKHTFNKHLLSHYLDSETVITSLIFDTNSYLWLGTSIGDILILEPGLIDSSEDRLINRIQLDTEINTLVNGFNGKIWAGTKSGLYEISGNRPVSFSDLDITNVTAIYPLSKDSLICVSRNEVFTLVPSERKKTSYDLFTPYLNQEVLGIFMKNTIVYFLQQDRLLQFNPGDLQLEVKSTIDLGSNTLPENKTVHTSGPRKVLIGTSDGILESVGKRLYLKPLMLHYALNNQHIHAITEDNSNTTWFSTNNGLFSSDSTKAIIRRYTYADGLGAIQFKDRLAASAPNGSICFAGDKDFVVFLPSLIPEFPCDHTIEIMDVDLMGRGYEYLKSLIAIDSITVDPIYRHMKFSFASLDYWNPDENRIAYSFVKAGKSEDWIALENENSILISGLRAGVYSLKVDGTNHSGHWNSQTRELIVRVNAPIWQSRIAIISYGVFLVLLIYILIYFRTKHLWKLNREYKEREIIAKQVEHQKEELVNKNKNITDSINYAKRIQMALMPSRKLFAKKFPESFILHMPKDIVSGDFYWINEVGGRIYFAAVDCTGHGVPGAFMSIIGFELFRRITEIEKKKQPAEILNSLSKGFETIFQDVDSIILRDGMDVAFCAVDVDMNVLEFAGAFNPLYLVRDNTITEIKGDRCSVGLDNEFGNNDDNTFSDHVIQLQEGDIIYIFTDGFADQFGGPEGKKYKYRRFRHLLLALHQLPMERQVEFLQRSILDWKGDLDQVDDILVMGIRISKKQKISK